MSRVAHAVVTAQLDGQPFRFGRLCIQDPGVRERNDFILFSMENVNVADPLDGICDVE